MKQPRDTPTNDRPRRSGRNTHNKPSGIQKHGIIQRHGEILKPIDPNSIDFQKSNNIQVPTDIKKPKKIQKVSNIQKPTDIRKPASNTQDQITIFQKTGDGIKRVTLITPPKRAQDAENSQPTPPSIEEATWIEPPLDPDNLLELPTKKTAKYLDARGRKKFDDRYVQKPQTPPWPGEDHPKIKAAERNGTCTRMLRSYYRNFGPKVNLPLAGTSKEPPYPDYPTN